MGIVIRRAGTLRQGTNTGRHTCLVTGNDFADAGTPRESRGTAVSAGLLPCSAHLRRRAGTLKPTSFCGYPGMASRFDKPARENVWHQWDVACMHVPHKTCARARGGGGGGGRWGWSLGRRLGAGGWGLAAEGGGTAGVASRGRQLCGRQPAILEIRDTRTARGARARATNPPPARGAIADACAMVRTRCMVCMVAPRPVVE